MFPNDYFADRHFANRYWPSGATAPSAPGGGYFPDRYFAARYFANRYWPIGAGAVPPAPAVTRAGGGNMLMRRETPIIPHDNRQRAAILEALEDEW